MTRDEALELLDLPATAGPAEAARAFESLYNDFRIRLDNAPTDSLRRSFEERLARLAQARAVLGGGASEPYHDLPASAPVERTSSARPVAGGGGTDGGAPPRASGRLLFRSRSACTVSVDGTVVGDAGPDAPLLATVWPGAHMVSAVAADGARWEGDVTVAAGQQALVDLPLRAPAIAAPPRAAGPGREPVAVPTPAPDGSGRRRAAMIAGALLAVVVIGVAFAQMSRDSVSTDSLAVASPALADSSATTDRAAAAAPAATPAAAAPPVSEPVRGVVDSSAAIVARRARRDSAAAATRLARRRADSLAARRADSVAEAARIERARVAEQERRAGADAMKKYRSIYHAAGEGDVAAVRGFLDAGASPDAMRSDRWAGLTSLMEAARFNHADVVRLLLDRGANIEARAADGGTSLHLANYQQSKAFRVLVERGANIHARDNRQRTPLHNSGANGWTEMANLLLDRGADINARDDSLMTPLHYSARSGHVGPVRNLVNRGADLAARDRAGRTPLDLARQEGRKDAIAILEAAVQKR